MASRFILPFADVGSGIKPPSGAQLFFFETDGVTPKDTYSDSAATVPNANPVIANSVGVFSDIYIVGSYKVTLKDNNDVQIFGLADITESLNAQSDHNILSGRNPGDGSSHNIDDIGGSFPAIDKNAGQLIYPLSGEPLKNGDIIPIGVDALNIGGFTFYSMGVLFETNAHTIISITEDSDTVTSVVTNNGTFKFTPVSLFKGFPLAPEMANKQIRVVCGTIRQQQSQTVVSITRSGSTATFTQTSHGYPNGARINSLGADQPEYNGFFQISNVTTDTYDVTVAGTPATPATGTLTARRPAQWDWINDADHEPLGVVSDQPVIATDTMVIPFTDTFDQVLYFNAGPDDYFAWGFNSSIGASVGLSSATLFWSQNRTLSAEISYNGASFDITYGPQQGGSAIGNVNIDSVSMSGSGLVTITHDYLQGTAVSMDPMTTTGSVVDPLLPIMGQVSNTSITARIFDPVAGSYQITPTTATSFKVVKSYSGLARFDGLSGDADRLGLQFGNIWMYGIMQL